ncbi:MAG: acetoin utilization protein AcuB [Phenylobacterium sp.]|jgi:acetoin utilization protein AcuB
MSVAKIMSTDVVTVEMDDPLWFVRDIFNRAAFHHLLVVGQDGLCGVISDRDLLKALSPTLDTAAETTKDRATLSKKAHQILTRKPVTLPPTASVYEAIDIFNEYPISCIPVVNRDNKPVGILSWRDILKAVGKKSK